MAPHRNSLGGIPSNPLPSQSTAQVRLFYHLIMIFHEEGTGIEKHGSKLTLNPHESTDISRFYLLTPDLKMER